MFWVVLLIALAVLFFAWTLPMLSDHVPRGFQAALLFLGFGLCLGAVTWRVLH